MGYDKKVLKRDFREAREAAAKNKKKKPEKEGVIKKLTKKKKPNKSMPKVGFDVDLALKHVRSTKTDAKEIRVAKQSEGKEDVSRTIRRRRKDRAKKLKGREKMTKEIRQLSDKMAIKKKKK